MEAFLSYFVRKCPIFFFFSAADIEYYNLEDQHLKLLLVRLHCFGTDLRPHLMAGFYLFFEEKLCSLTHFHFVFDPWTVKAGGGLLLTSSDIVA